MMTPNVPKPSLKEVTNDYFVEERPLSIAEGIIGCLSFLPDVAKVLSLIAKEVAQAVSGDTCGLFLFDGNRGCLALKALYSSLPKKDREDQERFFERCLREKNSPLWQVVAQANPLRVNDIRVTPDLSKPSNLPSYVRSLFCFPLFTHADQVCGASFCTRLQPGWSGQIGKAALKSMGTALGTVIGNVLLYETLQGVQDISGDTVRELTESLRKSEERYRLLVQDASDGIFVYQDEAFKVRNKRFDELFGSSPQLPRLRKSDRDLFFHQIEVCLAGQGGKVTSRAKLPNVELTLTHHSTTKVEVEVALTAIEYLNRPAVQGLVRDITSRRKLEELKSNFLSMAAHELRTTLTLIMGYNKLLLKKETGPLTPTQRKIIRGCQHSGDRLACFVTELLELSRLGTGGMNLSRRKEGITHCVRNVVNELTNLAKEKGISLQEKIPTRGAAKRVYMDRNKIEHVLINLTKNAIQHTPKGGIVEVEVRPGSGDFVSVCVSDTGTGVSEDERERIFGEFIIGKNSKSEDGMGLGLSICKKIIELHNGRIWVEPREGGGSRFLFSLPVSRA